MTIFGGKRTSSGTVCPYYFCFDIGKNTDFIGVWRFSVNAGFSVGVEIK